MIKSKNDKAVSVCFSGHRNIPLLYRKRLKQLLIKEITKAYADGYRFFTMERHWDLTSWQQKQPFR